jgi:MoaA/NifB/PqqE/SkfB family radical SAM enzyme
VLRLFGARPIMSFQQLIEKARSRDHLFSVLLELTYRCNLDCYFCYNDVGLRGTPLSKEQYFDLFSELREMEVLDLILSGGEPLAHPDFFALGSRARELGFLVRLKSNGHALRGRVLARVREEVDPFIVEISLHGATAEVHDRQTRVPGSFDRLMENIPQMLSCGLRVKLNSCVTAWNEHDIEERVALAERLGAALQFDPEVTPRDDGDSAPLSIRPSDSGLRRLFSLQAASRRAAAAGDAAAPAVRIGREADSLAPSPTSGKHCGAGSTTVTIDPYGSVYPCVQWRRPIGNLHQRSIAQIWSGSTELESIRELNRKAKTEVASLGPAGALVGFCPGSAARDGGDAAALYPEAVRRLDLQREAVGSAETVEVGARRPLLPVLR